MSVRSEGNARLLRRWPGLPLLSVGLFVAYVFCLYSNTISASAPRASLAFYTLILVMCAIGVAFPKPLHALLDKPAVITAFGVVATVGTVVICSSGLVPDALVLPVTIAGTLLSAAGSSALALKSLMLLGRMNITSIWLWMAYTELVVVGLYFAIAASPTFVNVVVISVLPLLCAGCIRLSHVDGSYFREEPDGDERMPVKSSTLAKFFLFVLLLSATAAFAKSLSFMALAEDGTLSDLAWPAWERVVIAAFILVVLVYFAKRFPFSMMCMFAIIVLMAMIGCLMLSYGDSAAFFFLSTLIHSTIECAALAFSACLIHKAKRSAFVLAGLALVALYGGSTIVYWIDFLVPLDVEEPCITYGFYVSAALTILMSLLFFQERTFDTLLGPVDRTVIEKGTAASSENAADAADTREQTMAAAFRDTYFLSPREVEVALIMRSGKTVNRIAEEMHLSVYTVRGYIQSIYAKCGVHSKDEFLDLLDRI